MSTVEEKTTEKEDQEESEDDEIIITDSEDDDPFNESLEPVFKKIRDTSKLKPSETNSCDSEADKSSDADKYEDCDTTSKKSVSDDTESDKLDALDSTVTETNDISKEIEKSFYNNIKIDESNINLSKVVTKKSVDESHLSSNENSANESKKRIARGTYFVKDTDYFVESLNNDVKDKYMETDKDNLVEEISLEAINKLQDSPKDRVENVKISGTTVDKILKSVKKQESIDNSLTQFEKLETAANDFNDSNQNKNNYGDFKIVKEKRTYFNDDTTKSNKIETDVVEDNKTDPIPSKAVEKTSVESFLKNFNAKPLIDKTNDQKSIVDEATEKVPLRNNEKDVEITQPVKNDTVNSVINITEEILVLNPIKQKRTYFDNIAKHTQRENKIVDDLKETENEERSPSIVKDDFDNYYGPGTSKKLLGDGLLFQKPNKKHESVDLFEPDSPYFKHVEITQDKAPDKDVAVKEISTVELVRKSIERLVLEQKTRHEKQEGNLKSPVVETAKFAVDKTKVSVETKQNENYSKEPVIPIKKSIDNISEAKPIEQPKITITEQTFNDTQNTTAEFENIYKDVSKHRDTEFDMIVTQMHNAIDRDDSKPETYVIKNEETKYNLRKKDKFVLDDKPKRNLRLRRRKNQDEETHSDPDQESRSHKLKDLLNLKQEFSDVTMGLPAVKKVVKDIPSPEKRGEENMPPPMGIQSCPANRYIQN